MNADAGFWWESKKERDHQKNLDVGGMNLREIGWDGMGWIDLAQDRDQWKGLVCTVINIGVPYNVGGFLSS
jgi:hypothetical protein